MLKKLLHVPLLAATCVFAQMMQTIPTKAYTYATYVQNLSVGTVTTVPDGTPADAHEANTPAGSTLNLTLPQGPFGSIRNWSGGAMGDTLTASVNSQTYVMAPSYNAKCDGSTDDSTAIQNALNAAGTQGMVTFPPNKVCLAHGLIGQQTTQLALNGSTLRLNQAGGTIFTFPNAGQATPATGVRPSIRDGFFDCNSLSGNTVGLAIHNAGLILENVTAQHCATGADLTEGQYGEYHSFYLTFNTVGMKIYADPTNGSGVDNSFYDAWVGYNQVGIIFWDNSTYPQGENNFYHLRLSVNVVAGMAILGNPANPGLSAVNIYHGYGEVNAQGSPSNFTVDGLTIKPASIYVWNAAVNVEGWTDSTPQYLYRLESNSTAAIRDGGGFGNPGEYYASADATSLVQLTGSGGGNGIYQNVTTWPTALSGSSRLSGSPVSVIDPFTSNGYTGNPFTIGFITQNNTNISTVTDPVFGKVSQATFPTSPGNVNINRVILGNAFGAFPSVETTVASDYVFSILVKASVNCNLTIQAASTGLTPYFADSASLVAGQWTRIVLAQMNVPAGTRLDMVAFLNDTTGASVSFTNAEMIALPTGTATTAAAIAHVLRDGAVGPNGYSVIGKAVTGAGAAVVTGPTTTTTNHSSCYSDSSGTMDDCVNVGNPLSTANTVQSKSGTGADLALKPGRALYLLDQSGNAIGVIASGNSAYGRAVNWLSPFQLSDFGATANSGQWLAAPSAQAGNYTNVGAGTLSYWYAATPPASENSNKVATTAFVKANLPLTGTTGSIGGAALTAGTCTSNTVSITGATTAMSVIATPTTYPGDAFNWKAYVSSAGVVIVKVCTNLAAGGTPTASTYNVRVIQ